MIALIIGQMLSMVLNFVLPVILVRILTNNDYGLYAQFNVILSFCAVFFGFGFSSDLYNFYPLANGKEKRVLVFQSFLMLFIAGLIAAFVLYLPVVRQYVQSDEALNSQYLFLTIAVWLSVPEILISTLYVLNHNNKMSAVFLPLMTILRVGFIFLLYWKYPCIESVFIAIVLSAFVKFSFLVSYVFRLIKKYKGRKLINMQVLKKQLSYSAPLGIASSIRVFVQQMDKLMILAFVSPAVYAVYSIAFYGVPGLTQVYLSISQVYIPRMAIAFNQNKLDNVIALYHSMVSKTLSYTIPIVFIIILFADPIIPFVFSPKYAESIPYFQIYLLTFLVSSVGCGNILRAIGETKRSLLAYIYTAVILLPFTYFAIKYYSLNGAIIAATLGAILPKILLSIYDAKSIKSSLSKLYPWKTIIKILIISSVCIIPFILIYFYIGHAVFGTSIFWILIYLCFTFCLQIYFGVFVVSYAEILLYAHKIICKK